MNFILCCGLCFLLNFGHVTGWWFFDTHNKGKKHSQATKDLDLQCLAHGNAGRCAFYSCFERRLPCGKDGYTLKYGEYYCKKISANYHRFNTAGKQFLNSSSQCLSKRLVPLYRQTTINCHDLFEAAMQDVSSCYLKHGFCQIFWDNKEALWGIYEFKHLFEGQSLNIWKELIEIALECGGSHIATFISWATQKFSFNMFG